MGWIYYVEGLSNSNKVLTIGIGISSEPELEVASLARIMPYKVRLAAMEYGDLNLLEQRREQFISGRMNGMWFQPTENLSDLVRNLPVADREEFKGKRVSLDLSPEEFERLETLVSQLGTTTKARLLRKALRFYESLAKYKGQGYLIQAVKGGSLIQFPDLDDIRYL